MKTRIVAEAVYAEDETIHNMPGGAMPNQVYVALLVVDQYGQRFLQEWEQPASNSRLVRGFEHKIA